MPPKTKKSFPTFKVNCNCHDDTKSICTDTGLYVTKQDDNHHNFTIRHFLTAPLESTPFHIPKLE